MSSLRANLLARHAAHDAELTRRHLVLADLVQLTAPAGSPRSGTAEPFRFPRPLLLTLCRELFVAARPAWAGLACVWLLLLAFTTTNNRATPPAAHLASTPSHAPETPILRAFYDPDPAVVQAALKRWEPPADKTITPALLDSHAASLAELADAVRRPHLRFPADYKKGLGLTVPHVGGFLSAAYVWPN